MHLQKKVEDVEDSTVAKLTNKIEQSILGDILKQSEDRARETATGRITEAIVQLYGASNLQVNLAKELLLSN